MEAAPLFDDIAEGPPGGRAFWLRAADGVRIRIGLWQPAAAEGTVLLFPGRTEYVEKYGRLAADFAAAGLATLVVDWRGQGLADRLAPDPMMGHVERFTDYQLDVAAVMAAVDALGLPGPRIVLGHSMGGSIAFRALGAGLAVAAAAFSAPMWGILMPPHLRPLAWAVSEAARPLGLGRCYAPATDQGVYVLTAPFEDNKLTRDPEMYAYMQRQLRARPDLAVGGPSLAWLGEALREMRAFRGIRPPAIPALAVIGGSERIVDATAVAALMARWPEGRFEIYPDAEHEIPMERPPLRARFVAGVRALMQDAAAPRQSLAAG